MAVDMSWTDKASCLDAEINLFTLETLGSRVVGNLNEYEIWFDNRDRFDRAISEYCDTCPVKRECWENGERLGDNQWTVRGGQYPVGFNPEEPEPPKSNSTNNGGTWIQNESGEWVCWKAGHKRDELSALNRKNRPFSSGECGVCYKTRRV